MAVGSFLQSCSLEFPEVGVVDCQDTEVLDQGAQVENRYG